MDLNAIFLTVSLHLGLPEGLLSSVCYVESRHIASAINHKDGKSASHGICQLKLIAARHVGYKGTKDGLMDPAVNIYYSGKYLKYQLKRYNNNPIRAVIAYNIGHAKNLTTTAYQRKVFELWRRNK